MIPDDETRLLPGEDLVTQGLADLANNRPTALSFLVLAAAPRLRRLGFEIPDRVAQPEHQLYSILEEHFGTDAYSQYNSLIRRIVSYARALERERSHRRI